MEDITNMQLKKILPLVLVLLLAFSVGASSVTRDIKQVGEGIIVTLTYINDANDKWLLLHEIYPEGWQLLDDGGGTAREEYHQIKWADINNPQSKTFTYKLLPNPNTVYGHVGTFDGTFQVSSMSDKDPSPIFGVKQINLDELNKPPKEEPETVDTEKIGMGLVYSIPILLILTAFILFLHEKSRHHNLSPEKRALIYIKEQRRENETNEHIKKKMLSHGWDKQVVDRAFLRLKK